MVDTSLTGSSDCVCWDKEISHIIGIHQGTVSEAIHKTKHKKIKTPLKNFVYLISEKGHEFLTLLC